MHADHCAATGASRTRGTPRGGIVTEGVRVRWHSSEHARDPAKVGQQIREAYTFSQSSLSPVALLLTRI